MKKQVLGSVLLLVSTSICSVAAWAQDEAVGNVTTQSHTNGIGFDMNARLTTATYSYKEPGIMSLSGTLTGVGLGGSQLTSSGLLLQGDLEYLSGTQKYDGALMSGKPFTDSSKDYVYEIRGLIGKNNIPVSGSMTFDWSSGLGYRYLNDRGQSSAAYEREQSYTYIPAIAGLTFDLGSEFTLRPSVELDLFLGGSNTTHLEDVDSKYPTIHLKQGSGYGNRLGVTASKKMGSVTGFAKIEYVYWHIDDSDYKEVQVDGDSAFFYEPENKTSLTALSLGANF